MLGAPLTKILLLQYGRTNSNWLIAQPNRVADDYCINVNRRLFLGKKLR